jgi:hypothetical protein
LIFDNKKARPVVTTLGGGNDALKVLFPLHTFVEHYYCSRRFFVCQPFCIPFCIPQTSQKARYGTIGTAEKASKKP